MGKIYPYTITKAHEDNVRASGFDAHDPDKRYQVAPNRLKQTLLSHQNIKQHGRAQSLLADRVKAGRGLVRTFLASTALLLLAQNSPAYAYHPDIGEWDPAASLVAVVEQWELDQQSFQPQSQWEVEPGLDETMLDLPDLTAAILKDAVSNEALWQLGLLGLLAALSSLSLLVQVSIRRTLAPMNAAEDEASPAEENAGCVEQCEGDQIEPQLVPSPYCWHLEGATRTGKARQENQDAFGLATSQDARTGFVLCDGAGGHAGGKEASAKAVEFLLPHIVLHSEITKCIDPRQKLLRTIERAQQAAIHEAREGITTAILVLLEEDWMHFATLGDGGLAVIWPDGMISQHLVPHHVRGYPSNQIAGFIGKGCDTPPRVGSIRLEPGCMMLAMSDGASDLFNHDHFADNRDRYRALLESPEIHITDHLLKQIEEARNEKTGAYLHHDNMTLVAATLSKNDEEADRTTPAIATSRELLQSVETGRCPATLINQADKET